MSKSHPTEHWTSLIIQSSTHISNTEPSPEFTKQSQSPSSFLREQEFARHFRNENEIAPSQSQVQSQLLAEKFAMLLHGVRVLFGPSFPCWSFNYVSYRTVLGQPLQPYSEPLRTVLGAPPNPIRTRDSPWKSFEAIVLLVGLQVEIHRKWALSQLGTVHETLLRQPAEC